MLTRFMTIMAVLAVLFAAAPATADWDPGQPAKWVQLPDLSPQGTDINASIDLASSLFPTPLVVLADDFLCTSTDPITDVHLWGSWLNDLLPEVFDITLPPPFMRPDPGALQVHLSIRADIPASLNPAGPFSVPGELLWSHVFNPGEFAVRPYAENIEEGWYDPISGNYQFPGDTVAWQYNFLIPEDEAFVQQGTPENPVIYWLDVAAIPEGNATGQPLFGWKTSIDHFNDTAVYGAVDLANWPEPNGWLPIPDVAGVMPIDLAFVITPEPATLALLTMGGLMMLRRK